MAQKAYIGINGISKNVKNIYVGVNGVARKVVKGYVGDENGVARLFWDGGEHYDLNVNVTTSIRNSWEGGNALNVGVATSIRNSWEGINTLDVNVKTSIRNG